MYDDCISEWDMYFTLRSLKSGETLHVDLSRGERDYDVVMNMKLHGLLFVSEGNGFIDRIAITPVGARHYRWMIERGMHRKWRQGEKEIANLTEDWNKKYTNKELKWQRQKGNSSRKV